MFQKTLLSKEFRPLFSDIQNLNNLAINPKVISFLDLAFKDLQKRQNQVNFGYFSFYLNTKVHNVNEIVLVRKNVYYRNILFFVQYIQNLVTFKAIFLIKANLPILLKKSVLKQYTFKLIKFDHNTLNNDLVIKN